MEFGGEKENMNPRKPLSFSFRTFGGRSVYVVAHCLIYIYSEFRYIRVSLFPWINKKPLFISIAHKYLRTSRLIHHLPVLRIYEYGQQLNRIVKKIFRNAQIIIVSRQWWKWSQFYCGKKESVSDSFMGRDEIKANPNKQLTLNEHE